MATEFATVDDNDPESLICICTNSTSEEGLPQCNADGILYHLELGEVPEGLAEMPDDPNELYTLCRSCGRVYRDQTIRDTGTAPVYAVVDVKEGPVADSISAHDMEMNRP